MSLTSWLSVLSLAILLSIPAFSSESDRTDLVRASAIAGATEQERQILKPEFDRYLALGGDPENAAWVIGTGIEYGCRESCLTVLVRGMSDTMRCGVQDRRASDLVIGVLEQQIARRDKSQVRWNLDQLAAHLSRGLFQMVTIQCQRS